MQSKFASTAWLILVLAVGCSALAQPNQAVSSPGAIIWSKRIPKAEVPIFGSIMDPPAVSNGRVYVSESELFCLDAGHGQFLWTSNRIRSQLFRFHPAIFGNRIYDGVNCYNRITGKALWWNGNSSGFRNRDLGFPGAFSAPSISGNRIFYGGNDSLVCLDARNGKLLWRFGSRTSVCNLNFFAPPVVSGERVFASSNDTLFCFNAMTGRVLWRFVVPRSGFPVSAPTVYKGRVLLEGGNYGELHCAKLLCIDAQSGKLLWKSRYSNVGAPPSVSRGRVIFSGKDLQVSLDPELVCLDYSSGKVLWHHQYCYIGSPIAISNGRLYFHGGKNAEKRGGLTCARLSDGKIIWVTGLIGAGSEPVLAGGRVFTRGPGIVYCLDAGDSRAGGWEMSRGGPEHQGSNAEEERGHEKDGSDR